MQLANRKHIRYCIFTMHVSHPQLHSYTFLCVYISPAPTFYKKGCVWGWVCVWGCVFSLHVAVFNNVHRRPGITIYLVSLTIYDLLSFVPFLNFISLYC